MAAMQRRAVRSALCWGDTSTAWDWMARIFTLSDGASALAAEGVDGFDALWQGNALMFVAHAARLRVSHREIHGRVDAIDVSPRINRVGRTSFAFACDFNAAGDGALLAETRGTFVHVDPTGKSAPVPDAAAAGLRARAAADAAADWMDDFGDPGGFGSKQTLDWSTVVRRSDTDSLGHVNNARWAHFAMDAREAAVRDGAADVAAIAVEYKGQVMPGEILTAGVSTNEATVSASRVARQFDFRSSSAPDAACTVVRILEQKRA